MKQSEAQALIRDLSTADANGCWIFPVDEGRRYGEVYADGKKHGAHRIAYLAFKGRIGKKHVLHSCDVTACVNTDHLFLGTHAENMKDMAQKDRSGVRELANPHGRLTDQQVRELRNKHARGFPVSWLAAEYGLTNRYVRDIVRRRQKGNYPARHHADEPA